ncbi:MAG: hypothetical protein KatS3mg035_1857 [Bacteroidia bacterium]|nr:MAG: hypothetical protein KatS3mg035_1857 [Bacteroidia bacterium]
MDRKSYRSAFKPINFLVVLWITSVIIHGISGLIVLYNEQYLLNDSVIYLTMAHNFKIYGVISQSFYEPIVPDFQRSPLYPIFLSLVPVPYVVFFQHLLILLAGYFIQKINYFF